MVAALALSALVLTGCSSSKSVGIGEQQLVDVGAITMDTKAKLNMTVTEVETRSVSESGLELDSEFSDGVLFLAHFTAQVAEGSYAADDTYSLGADKWAARGQGEISTLSGGWFGTIELPGCPQVSTEMTEDLANGGVIEACQIFVSADSGEQVEKVVFGKPAISYKGRDKGWSWTTNG